MELDGIEDLIGAAGLATVEAATVLRRPEPLVVRIDRPVSPDAAGEAAAALRDVATVTVVVGDPALVPDELVAGADVCLADGDDPPRPWVRSGVDEVTGVVGRHPEVALALVALLRSTEGMAPWSAIAAESATYSMLLASRDHLAWLAERGPTAPRPSMRPPVRLERDGSRLVVTLDRAEARNAVDRATRDALVEALGLVARDPSIESVRLRGAGPGFSAGGDLREFGSTRDPATAFAVRLTSHPGWAAHLVSERLTAELHGPCIGAGIEIPAFAGRVTAEAGTQVSLPELSMGLIPGAGGTVSLPRRIGRHRTAWLALTGAVIDAATAARWGLVDEIVAGR